MLKNSNPRRELNPRPSDFGPALYPSKPNLHSENTEEWEENSDNQFMSIP